MKEMISKSQKSGCAEGERVILKDRIVDGRKEFGRL